MRVLLRGSLVLLGYLLTGAAVIPGLLVIAMHGYARYVGGGLWLVVPASLVIAAAMVHLTLRLRDDPLRSVDEGPGP